MDTKAPKTTRTSFRYDADEIEPRDSAAAEQFADKFVARNRDAINEALKSARASLKAGKGVAFPTSEKLADHIMRKVRRRSSKT